MSRPPPAIDRKPRRALCAWIATFALSGGVTPACVIVGRTIHTQTRKASAVLTGTRGQTDKRGSVSFSERALSGGGLVPRHTASVRIEVAGLSPGAHGAAVTTARTCDAVDTAPHLNPGDGIHGGLHDVVGHAGDLGNIDVGPSGHGTLVVDTITAFGHADAIGRAFVVYAAPDDGVSQPDGNSGAAVLCGVLVAD